tara:strand:- start:6407 stop:19855 length:13449 start_codon:yes stop_codon:yes gene_type:complete
MNDVNVTSLSDNEILQYDTASSKWINQTLAEADIASAATLSSHTGSTSNPHNVTAAQVNLGNVTNESKATMFTSPVFTGNPTAPTQPLGNDSVSIATTAFVDNAINALIAAAPDTLDTLNEIAEALNDDADFHQTITDLANTKLPLAGGTMTGNLNLGDDVKLQLGGGNDLQIFHDQSDSIIKDAGTGNLELHATNLVFRNHADSAQYASFINGGAVSLYHNNGLKFQTAAGGIDITGNLTVGDSHFIGDDSFDNLALISSSGENVVVAAANDIYLNTDASGGGTGTNRVLINESGTSISSGTLKLLDGTASSPSLTFTSGTNTGIYWSNYTTSPQKDQLNLSVDGNTKFKANEAGIWSVSGNIYLANGYQFRTFQEWLATTGGTGYGFKFRNTADAVDSMTISSAGNVVAAGTITGTSFHQSDQLDSTFYSATFDENVDINGYLEVAGKGEFLGGTLNVHTAGNINYISSQDASKDLQIRNTGANKDIVIKTKDSSGENETIRLRGSVNHIVASGNIEARFGTNSRTFNLYETYSDSSNYERTSFNHSGGYFNLSTQDLGTGTASGIKFKTDDLTALSIEANGLVTVLSRNSASSTNILSVGGSSNGYMSVRHIEGKASNSNAYGPLYINYLSNNNVFIASGGGKVGIGTTTPARKLEVSEGSSSIVAQFKSTSGTSAFITLANTTATADQIRVGSIGNDLVLSTNYAERMRILSDGKVGIGTTNPAELLHVEGSNATINVRESGAATVKMRAGSVGRIGTYSDNDFSIVSNSTDRVRIKSDGKVGIGTTSVNTGIGLQVANGHLYVTSGEVKADNINAGYFSSTRNLELQGGSAAGVKLMSGATTVLQTKSDGKVGIGTTSPDHTLRVNGDARLGNLHIKTSDFGQGGTGKTIYADGAGSGVLGFISSTAFDFSNGATSRLRIDSSGNVGIGTTSPSYKLEIDGGDFLVNTTNGGYVQVDESDNSLKLSDNVKIKAGTGNDLSFYHNSSNNISFIENSHANGLRIKSDELLIFAHNGSTLRASFDTAVKLLYNDAYKFETTADGAKVIGTLGIGDYAMMKSTAQYMGMIGFNRNGNTGAIYNNSYGAFQLQNNNGVFEFQCYNSSGAAQAIHKFTSDGRVGINTAPHTNQQLHIVASSTDTTGLEFSASQHSNETRILSYDRAVGGGYRPLRLQSSHLKVEIAGVQKFAVDTSGNTTLAGNLTVGGDLTINGTTTTLNAEELVIEDKNIVIGNVPSPSSPSDTTADGGGITLKGASDYTINWTNSTNSWHFNQGITVGENDTGYDVKFYGATSNRYLHWNQAEDRLNLRDNTKFSIGNSNDLQLEFNGTHSYIKNNVGGSLYIQTANTIQLENSSGQDMLTAASGGAVKLFHGGNSTAKFETTTAGATVTGKLGIGVTSPSTPLHVKGNVRAEASGSTAFADLKSSQIYASGTYDLIVGTNNPLFFRTNDTRRMTILGDGKVGIGTTNPLQELHLSSPSPVIRLQDSDGTNQFTEIEQAGQSLYISLRNNSQNGHLFILGKNGTGTDTVFMKIASDGKVGLGTQTPARELSVVSPTSNAVFQLSNSTAGESADSGLEIFASGVDTGIVNRENGYLRFDTNNTERARFLSSGQFIVGGTDYLYSGTDLTVGNTSDSQNGLNIVTSSSGNGYVLFGDGAAAAAYVGQIRYSHTDNFMSFNTNGSERLRINSEGCLGINTTNPLSGAKLDVAGKTRIYQNEFQITSSAAYTTHFNYQNGGNNYISQANGGGTFFRNNGGTLMFLNSAGDFGVDSDTLYVDASTDRVGIGTNSPAAPLSLVGVNGGNWNDGLIIDDPSGWAATVYKRNNSPKMFTGLYSGNDNYIWMSTGYSNSGTTITAPRADAVLMARPGTDDLQIYLDTHFGGKVGIGNDNPDEKLDVAGNAVLKNGTTSTSLTLYETYTDTSNFEKTLLDHSGGYFEIDTGALGSGSLSGIKLSVGSYTKLQIEPEGHVLINGADDNGNKADFSVGVGTSPRVSWHNQQVQIGGLDMNYNGNISHTGSVFGMTSWSSSIEFRCNSSSGASARDIYFMPFNGTSTSEAMRIKGSGNVGIATDAPATKLQIDEYTVGSNGNQSVTGTASIFTNSGSDGLYLGVKNASHPNRGYAFKVTSNGVNSDFTIREHGLTGDRFTIQTGGSVGIATTSPSSQFYNNLVVGNNDSGEKGITIRSNASNGGHLAFSDTDAANAGRYAGRISYFHDTNSMRFYTTAGDFAMAIDSSQRVGIGVTTPDHRLHVDGTIAIKGGELADTARIHFQASDESNRFTLESDFNSTTTTDLLGFRSTTADNILVLKGNGNVGIGTTSNAQKLHIKGDALRIEESVGNRHLDIIPAVSGSSHRFTSTTTGSGYNFENSNGTIATFTETLSQFNQNVKIQTSNLQLNSGNYVQWGGSHYRVEGSNGNWLKFFTANVERLRITAAGVTQVKNYLDLELLNDADSTSPILVVDGTRVKKATNLHVYKDTNDNSYLAETGSGDLYIKGGNDIIIQDAVGNTLIHANQSDSVELHYGGVKRLETKTYGAELTHPSGWAELHLNGPSGGEIKLQKAGATHLDIYASDAGSTSSVIKAQSHLRLSSNNSVAANRSIYLKSDGFVGIGNDAPSHRLHVTGDARIEGNLTINGTTTIVDTDVSTTEQLLITNDGTGPAIVANQTGTQPVIDFQDDSTSVFYIENGGNVGIGTGSNIGANAHLEILKDNPQIVLTDSNEGTNDKTFRFININESLRITARTDGNTANTAGGDILTLKRDGHVVIGGTEPTVTGGTAKLTINVGATTNVPVTIANGTTDQVYLRRYTSGGKYQIQTVNGSSNEGVLSLQSYGGGVGIGTTDSSGFKLDVRTATGGAIARFKDSDSSHDGIRIEGDTNGGIISNASGVSKEAIYFQNSTNAIRLYTNGNERIRIASDGKVGIGTTSPAMPVEIVTGSGATVDLPNQTTGGIAFANNSGSNNVPTIVGKSNSSMGLEIIGAANNSNIHGDLVFNCRENNNSTFADTDQAGFKFQHYTTDLVTIYRSGKVGIGTSSPAETLHVSGSSSEGTGKVKIDNVPTESTEKTALVYSSGKIVSQRELGDNAFTSHPYLRTDDTGSTQTVNDPVTFTDLLKINDTGNAILDLNTTGTGSNTTIRFRNTDSNKATIGYDGGNSGLILTTGGFTAGNGIFIDDNQKVGIGTKTPNALLNVQGDSNPTILINAVTGNSVNSGKLAFAETDGGAHQAFIKYDGSANRLEIGTADVAQALVVNRTDGKVGIGTSTPSSLLNLSDASNNLSHQIGFSYVSGGTETDAFTIGRNSSTGNLEFHSDINNHGFEFKHNAAGTQEFNILNLKVGIGTDAPNRNLNVVGQIGIDNSASSPTGGMLITPDGNSNKIYSRTANNVATAHPLDFFAGSTHTVRIESDGDVDLQTGDLYFSTNGKGLHFDGVTGWDWKIVSEDSGSSNVPLLFKSQEGGPNPSAPSEKFRINSAGDAIFKDKLTVEVIPSVQQEENTVLVVEGSDGGLSCIKKRELNTVNIPDYTSNTNGIIKIGSDDDLNLYHTSGNNFVSAATGGNLFIQGNTVALRSVSQKNMVVGNVNSHVKLYYDNSERLSTTTGGITVTGKMTSDTITTALSLEMFASSGHNYISSQSSGSNLYIRNTGGGQILIRPKTGEDGIKLIPDGAVQLYHDNAKKFETTSTGIHVTASDPILKITDTSGSDNGATLWLQENDNYGAKVKYDSNSNTFFKVSTVDGGTETDRFSIKRTGETGIGTTSPEHDLHVAGETLLDAPNGSTHSLRLGRADNANKWFFNHAGNDLRIYNAAGSGYDIMLGVNSGGAAQDNKVGIGTASPAEKLDVNGYVRTKNSKYKKYTSLTGSSNDWFPIYQVNDHKGGQVTFNVNTYAHSSCTFVVSEGYGPSGQSGNPAHINVLNYLYHANGGYANITGIRVNQIGMVEIKLTFSSGPTVNVAVRIESSEELQNNLASSLATSTSTESIRDSVNLSNKYARFKNLTLGDDGSASSPALNFGSSGSTGLYYTSSQLNFALHGSTRMYLTSAGIFSSSNVYSGTTGQFRNFGGTWQATTGTGTNGFTFKNTNEAQTAATITSKGTLTLNGGTTSTKLYLYETYTDASNYERTTFDFSGGYFNIDTNKSGTGHTASGIKLGANGYAYLQLEPEGNVLINGANDNSNRADFAVGTLGNPRVSWHGNQVQIGGTDMNYNGNISYNSAVFRMQSWQSNISFELKGTSGTANKDIIFRPFNGTADTEAMRIKGSGDVCIGTTATMSSANARRLVVGDGAGTEGITIYSGNNSSGWLAFADGTSGDQSYRGIVQYSHANDAMSFHTQGTTERMRLNSTGLGIGTTNPAEKLHVEGRIRIGTTPEIVSHDNITLVIDQNANSGSNYLNIKGGTVELVRVKQNGNVGIGTTTPDAKLQVEGLIKQQVITVSQLPTPSSTMQGVRAFVSDSSMTASGNFGATIQGYGGGSNTVPVWCDGNYWYIG